MNCKKWGVLCASAALALSCMTVSAADMPVRSITVQGSGSLSVISDQASVNIGIETQSDTAQKAASDNASVMNAVKNAVIAQGIDDSQIHTSNYGLWPVYRYDKGKAILTGYKADNTLNVTVSPVAKTGSVMDAAVRAGANKINSVSFSLKNQDKYKDDVLRKAVMDARSKADVIASALNKQVVNVISVTEGNVRIMPVGQIRLMASDMAVKESTPIEPQNVDMDSQITVVFEIR